MNFFFFGLSAALSGGRAIDLINAACSEQGLLSLYHVDIPKESSEARIGAVDSVSQRIIQIYQHVLLEQYVPLTVLGDGNCFYRAVSRALCGNESLHIILRLKTAIEIIVNRKFYDTGRRSYVDLIKDNRIIVSEYKKLVEDTLTLGSYSEMIHIYALSCVLNIPIRSFYPPQIQPELASDAFSRLVVGRNVRGASSTNIVIMWTQMCVPQNVKRFSPNHFVTLREVVKENAVQVVLSEDEITQEIKVEDNKRKPKSLKVRKKKQKSESKLSVNVSAPSDQNDTDTSGQTDIVTIGNNGSLSSCTDPLEETEGCCNIDDSFSELTTSVGSELKSIPESNYDTNTKSHSKINANDEKLNDHDLSGQTDMTWRTDSSPFTYWPSTSDVTETEPDSFNSKQEKISDRAHASVDKKAADDSFASVDQSSSSACRNSLYSEADSDDDSGDMDSDNSQYGTLNGTFLDLNSLIKLLQQSDKCIEKIPTGLKENVYFVVTNDHNCDRKKNGQNSRFSDDCGVWEGKNGCSPITYFLLLPSGELKSIVKREHEGYCFKRKKKGAYVYEKLNPQPLDSEVIGLQRYYAKLKKDKSYEKRVSWLNQGGDLEIAVVEYIGKYPGEAPHGNSKRKTEYIRTPDAVMTEMADLLKSKKPKQVYDKLINENDELSGPTDLRQVHDMKRRQDLKERQHTGLTGSRQNVADHIIEIENRVSTNDPFIRSVIRQNGKAPCIILYNDEQIQDLKTLCCTGQTVLGVDKTFNLCDMHVTVTCYKQLSVTKEGTAEPPLFIGPIFIHDNSDFDTYCNFFFDLKIKLTDVDTSNLVIGTDDERALVNAIKTAFPQSHHILCTRHLRQNANQKLTDDAVDKYDKGKILDKIFGDDGLLNADDTICFDDKCEELESVSQSVSKNFLKYFQKRLKDILREKRKDPDVATQTDKLWTNNNCESVNHVLKQAVDWKRKPLLDFIKSVNELVDAQFKDLKRALVSIGRFRLADSHRQFAVSKSVWANKTDDERQRLFRRFRKHDIKNTRLVKSTDGKSDVVAPRTKGQKLGQRKRPRTERTTTVTVKKKKT